MRRPAGGGSCAGSVWFPLTGFAAFADELALELVELELVLGRPVEGGGEAGAAVELAGSRPVASHSSAASVSWRRKRRPGCPPRSIAQARPFAQQRFVGDLDGALADGHEPALGEGGSTRPVSRCAQVELGQRGPAAHDRLALAFAGEPKQDAAREGAGPAGEPLVGAFGQPGYRPVAPPDSP